MARRLIVEADGGSRGNPGPAAYGAVVKDADTGRILAEEGATIGVDTNNVAEYRGLIAGLRAAYTLDRTAEIEARLDSKLIVEQMSGRWKIKNANIRRLVDEATAAFPVQSVRYKWVPREQNKHADRLVNDALDGLPVNATHEPSSADAAKDKPPNALVGWSATHPTVTTTTLLRHGETIHTASKRFSGWGGDDPGLSDVGRKQAALTAEHLRGSGGIDIIAASPMARTRETADVVAAAIGADVITEIGLRECSFGEWDGLTFAEVQDRSPEQVTDWLAATSVRPPGGESFDEVAARVTDARDRLLSDYPGKVLLLVTHVTPVKTLVRLALNAPPNALFRMEVRPASLSTLQWFGDGHASLRTFNETAHLGNK